VFLNLELLIARRLYSDKYKISFIKEYFQPGQDYSLTDFVDRSTTALNIASDRVKAKYGRPCGLAISQLASIKSTATRFNSQSQPIVRVLEFIE
jgi:uncharacterized repeat protein (TIGR04042 family)